MVMPQARLLGSDTRELSELSKENLVGYVEGRRPQTAKGGLASRVWKRPVMQTLAPEQKILLGPSAIVVLIGPNISK